MKFFIIFLILFFVKCQADNDVTKLRKQLLESYDTNRRPIKNDSETTTVRLAFTPLHLLDMNEETESLITEGVISVQWTDEYLVWKSNDNANITSLFFADHEIWQPDIFLLYSAGRNSLNQDRDTPLLVNSEGLVSWYPPATFEVPCKVNYKYFPYDTHSCVFEFGSWAHSGDSIFLTKFDKFQLTPDMISGSEWKMDKYQYNVDQVYMSEKYPYNFLKFTLNIIRTSSLYKLTTVIPVISSFFMTLGGFWLDIWSSPRYIVGIANYVMVAFHLLNLATTIQAGNEVPLLAQFSATSVVLAIMFLAETVLLDSTERRRGGPPEKLVILSRRIPDRLLCALPFQSTIKPVGEEPEEDTKSGPKSDWRLVCLVVDRIFFYIFSLIYIVITSLLISI